MTNLTRVFVCIAFALSCFLPMARAERATTQVTETDQIDFQQKNAAAQMQELQERMYRLAELTREAEPDDAAKLLMAVRKAREELIVEQMKEVLELLGQKDLVKASSEEKGVLTKLEELKKLLLSTNLDLQLQLEKLKKLQETIAKLDTAIKEEKRQTGQSEKLAGQQKKNENVDPKEFANLQQDQQKNRASTETIQQMTKELGETGKKAMGSLMSASGSMSKAEGSLGGKKAEDAKAKQGEATRQLQEARAELDRQKKALLEEIEKQVKAQVMENLNAMLERQKSVREATEAISTRLASADRQAVLRAKQLGAAENHIVAIASQTIELIETTKFSIALPPAIKNIQKRVVYIVGDLNAGKGDAKVIANEKQVEKDLTALLETLKNSYKPMSKDGGGQCNGCGGNKNKLIGELKVVRMMQMQVNDDTRETDTAAHKAAGNAMSAQVKEQIGGVKDSQAQVQDAMDKLHHSVCPDCLKE